MTAIPVVAEMAVAVVVVVAVVFVCGPVFILRSLTVHDFADVSEDESSGFELPFNLFVQQHVVFRGWNPR